MIDVTGLIPFLAILLPFIMPFLGDGLASILTQDGFPQALNDMIAWLFLILAAVATALASNLLTGNANQLIGVVFGIVQLLLSGPLTALKPWVNLTALLQSKVFNVVPANGFAASSNLVVLKPPVVQPQSQQPLQGAATVNSPSVVNSAMTGTTIQPAPLQGVSAAQQFQPNPQPLVQSVIPGAAPVVDPWSDSQVLKQVKPGQ